MRFRSAVVSGASLLATTLLLSAYPRAHAAPAPPAALVSREACETALALEEAGKPTTSSHELCHAAAQMTAGQPRDVRNEVASMMSPAAHPGLDDMAVGALMADAAVRKDTRQPWGYLARCDLARRLGNADTLQGCLDDLRRVAPGDPVTKWALTVSADRPSFWIWAFRLILVAGVAGTAAHATLARLRRRRRRAAPLAVAALLCAFVLSGAGAARAGGLPKDHLSDFKIDDSNPEASVPSPEVQMKRPLEFGYFIQDLGAKAEKAQKAGDHAAAARYFGALAKAAPNVAYGARKMCEELEAAGDPAQAIKACRTAIMARGATAADFTRFVSLVLASKDPLIPAERTELETVIAHLQHEAQLGAVPTMLRCEVDLRFKDFPALEACTTQLETMAPRDPKTISLRWALAVAKHDRGDALALIDRARGIGMNGEGIARMERATRAMTMRLVGMLAVALAVMLGAAIALIRFRRQTNRRRLAV